MTVSAKIIVVATSSLFLAGAARAQQAAAPAEHCEGTLCDLYYGARGNSADPAPKPATAPVAGVPAGATPVMAPTGTSLLSSNPLSRLFGGSASDGSRPPPPESEPATATNSYMHMSTGGVLGDKQQRCTGTLCDTFYGSAPAEPEAPAAARQQATSVTAAAAAEPAIAYRHIPHESETRPKCSSPAADPWRCFRK